MRNKHTVKILSLIAVILIAASLVLLLRSRLSIELEVLGSSPDFVSYGETYQDPGATARLIGVLGDEIEIPVSAASDIDTHCIGTYTIRYTAQFLNWEAVADRKVKVKDTIAPDITLVEDPERYTDYGEAYEEEGYIALDNLDGDITGQVIRTVEGERIRYAVNDSSGNHTEVVRKVRFRDVTAPALCLMGQDEISIDVGDAYKDPGWTALDNCDGDLADQVTVDGTVDTAVPGTYTIHYRVTDAAGNKAEAARTIHVKGSASSSAASTEPKDKVIYLTFDDGPGKYTQELLDVLDKYGVKATFFTVDHPQYNDLIKAEFDAGHSVGVHSATHDYGTIYTSKEDYFSDLKAQAEIIRQETGQSPTLLRFPGGSSNTVSRKYCEGIMSDLTKLVEEKGYVYFDWNVSSGDAGETTETDEVYENVIAGVQRHDVSVVLQHDTHGFSVDAVERIIQWGLENGYTFLPLTTNSPTAHHGVNN